MRRRIAAVVITFAGFGMLAATVAVGPNAVADPTTTVNFPKMASATRFQGYAFDACTAPSLAAMTAWSASPYRAIGVYVGGVNRSCAQPNLTSQWVSSVTAQGWRLLPIYLGLQAPCSDRARATKIVPSIAAAEGTASAGDAIGALTALGLQPGSIVYNDMESYTPTDVACRNAVLRYLSSFTAELHRRGYLSGIYVNLGSGAAHLTAYYNSTKHARPDALWVARWDGKRTTAGLAGVPSTYWSVHQRAKQYIGDHDETHGGVKINIDTNWVDGPVATVVRPYFVTATTAARTAPTRTAPAAATITAGSQVGVVCQAPGTAVAGTIVWDKLSTGAYVTDHAVSTPSTTGYSAVVPRCYYPYQVTPTAGTIVRTGAGSTYLKKGVLYGGALAWTVCQKAATVKTGTTRAWDQIDTGAYVSDYYLATASKTAYTPPIPHC